METATYKPLVSQSPALAAIPDIAQQQQDFSPSAMFDAANEKPEEDEVVQEQVVQEVVQEEPVREEVQETVVEEEPKKTKKIESPLGEFEIPAGTEVTETQEEPVAEQVEETLPTSQKAAQQAFAAQKRQLKELKQKIAELQPKADETEALRKQVAGMPKVDPEIATRVKALDEDNQRLKEALNATKTRLAEVSLNDDDEYKSKVLEPFNGEILPVIKTLEKVTNGEVTKALVDHLATLDPVTQREQVRALQDKLDPQDLADLKAILPKYRQVISENEKLTKNASGRVELRKQEEERTRSEQFQKYSDEFTSSFDQHDSGLAKKFYGENIDPELKGALDFYDQRIKAINPLNTDPKIMSGIMAVAKHHPVIVTMLERQMEKQKEQYEEKIGKLEKENKELASANKKFTQATPNAGTTTTGAPKAVQKSDEIDLTKGGLTSESLIGML